MGYDSDKDTFGVVEWEIGGEDKWMIMDPRRTRCWEQLNIRFWLHFTHTKEHLRISEGPFCYQKETKVTRKEEHDCIGTGAKHLPTTTQHSPF